MNVWVRTTTSHSLLKQLIEAVAFGVWHVGNVQMTRSLNHSILNRLHCLRVSGFIGHLQPIDNEMDERMAGETDGRQVTVAPAYSQWRRSCCILCVQVDSNLLALYRNARAQASWQTLFHSETAYLSSRDYLPSHCVGGFVTEWVLSAYHE